MLIHASILAGEKDKAMILLLRHLFCLKFSPLTKLRIKRFTQNRRGFYSLWIFLSLFGICCFADFIANDQPLLVSYKNQLYFPILQNYPETTFGGEFDTTTNYKDPFVRKLIEDNGFMIWPLIPYGYDTINYDLPSPAPSPPSLENILGTDDQGRDLSARLIYGFRISLFFGLCLTLASAVLGIMMGGIQGYFGGRVDIITQRFVEIWSGLPILYLLIILSSLVDPNFWWLLGLMMFFKWTTLVGVVRAEFLRGRNFDYVRAARALGVPSFLIMFRHILPNAMVASLTYLPFILNASIATLTSLDFLGFGLPPGSPSLGEILSQGKNNLHAPWLGVTGFLSVSILLGLVTFIGEGVRDAFDPRKVF